MKLCCALIAVVLHLVIGKKTVERKISEHKVYEVDCDSRNPSRDNNSTKHHIVHIIATRTDNVHDNLHYVFAGVGRPTIFLKHFIGEKGSLIINETNICLQSGEAFAFHPNNSDISGIILDAVFPYDDSDDKVSLEGLPKEKFGDDVARNFSWTYKHSKEVENGKVMFKGSSNTTSGSLDFSVDVRLAAKNTKEAPSNPVHANLTQFRLDMVDLPTNFSKHTRYAVKVVFFSSGQKSNSGSYTTKKYIDDEFTPGNFQMFSVHFPMIFEPEYLFSAWKPVSYVEADRSRETQSLVKSFDKSGKLGESGDLDMVEEPSTWTMVNDIDGMKFYGMNVTYGLAKDGCYNLKPYMSWTGMVGYYKSPIDEISTLVIVVISVGIGAPAVMILAGIFVLVIRKVRLKSKTYEQIN